MTCAENGGTLETEITVQGTAREQLGQPARYEVMERNRANLQRRTHHQTGHRSHCRKDIRSTRTRSTGKKIASLGPPDLDWRFGAFVSHVLDWSKGDRGGLSKIICSLTRPCENSRRTGEFRVIRAHSFPSRVKSPCFLMIFDANGTRIPANVRNLIGSVLNYRHSLSHARWYFCVSEGQLQIQRNDCKFRARETCSD